MSSGSLATTAPYDLFHDEAERVAFQKKCLHCTRRDPDKHGMPQCDVFHYLVQSILDRTVRWELEWIKIGKGGPVCLLHAPEPSRK